MKTEGEFKFLRTLRQVKSGDKPPDAIVEDPEYLRRAMIICLGLAPERANADDLFQVLSLKVWIHVLGHFSPDYTKPYGNFFAWCGRIAHHIFIDWLPKYEQQFDEEQGEEALVEDTRPNPETECERRELEASLAELVESLPRKRRLAMRLFLKGRSFRRAARVLNRLKIKCSHSTVRNWVKDDLKPFFPESVIRKASGF